MPTGVEFFLKNAGIDVKEITAQFTSLKTGVTQTLQAIDGRLKQIEESQARAEASMMTAVQILQQIQDNQERVWKLVQVEQEREQAAKQAEQEPGPELVPQLQRQ